MMARYALATIRKSESRRKGIGRPQFAVEGRHTRRPDRRADLGQRQLYRGNAERISIAFNLTGPNPIVPSDEGFGSYLRTGFYRSFQILATSMMLIIIGASVFLPWALLIWAGCKVYGRINPAPPPPPVTAAVVPASIPVATEKPV